jgi:hypothetical protein
VFSEKISRFNGRTSIHKIFFEGPGPSPAKTRGPQRAHAAEMPSVHILLELSSRSGWYIPLGPSSDFSGS